ncbi:alpha/beta hydrolase [Paenibacillus algorifonticola]|uniref:alpha/beta fold hydrolase n=1 Tax=Paenibacillus algorifonticola TaxID=684063 RepID=UPI003D28C8CE
MLKTSTKEETFIKIFKSKTGEEQILQSYNHLLKMWLTEYTEVDIKTKYGITHCIIAGHKTNPPLLLFHGVGDNSAVMWLLNIQKLSQYFYCIAVDTIGGPGKSVPNKNFNKQMFNQVSWINQIADYMELDEFNIAGVSNGAYMAFNYAVNETERVNKVVCMEGGMVTTPVKTMLNTLLMMFPEMLIPTRNNLLKILKKLSSPHSHVFDKHPEVAEHLILLMKNHNQQAMFTHKLQKYDKEKAVAISDKLYFLLGGHKLNFKKNFIRILEDGNFLYKIIQEAGHGINHEQPETINQEIVNFLIDGHAAQPL